MVKTHKSTHFLQDVFSITYTKASILLEYYEKSPTYFSPVRTFWGRKFFFIQILFDFLRFIPDFSLFFAHNNPAGNFYQYRYLPFS